MDSRAAELSSLASALEDLRRRVAAIADDYAGTKDEAEAEALYEVERGLTGAGRRLARFVEAATAR